jgi:hypothetical protein
MAQALPQPGSALTTIGWAAGAAAMVAETALSLPSVPLSVDFSTWVAERERR